MLVLELEKSPVKEIGETQSGAHSERLGLKNSAGFLAALFYIYE